MEVIEDVTAKMCPYCGRNFSSHSALVKHLKKTKCGTTNNPDIAGANRDQDQDQDQDQENEGSQTFKGMTYVDLCKLVQHISHTCGNFEKVLGQQNQKIVSLETEIKSLKNFSPLSLTNNLNVLCLTGEEDYCKELINEGNTKQTLIYIKNCALAKLAGDCTLLSKIFCLKNPEGPKPTLMYDNKSKTKIIYYDRQRKRTVESNLILIAEKIAKNLQTTYLSGSKHLKNEDGTFKKISPNDPNLPIVEQYEIDMMNAQVHQLREKTYQMKLLKALPIPFRGDIEG